MIMNLNTMRYRLEGRYVAKEIFFFMILDSLKLV